MDLGEVKAAVRELSPEDRRKVLLYVLELEKDHIRDHVAPQLMEDLDGVTKAAQEAFEKIKQRFKGST
jgi:DNA-binding MarR family transcriptional regulator